MSGFPSAYPSSHPWRPFERASLRRSLRLLRHAVRKRVARSFVQAVPLASVLCDDRTYHGGKPIRHWPPTTFFSLYNDGLLVEAAQRYEEWYYETLFKYGDKPKLVGGMRGGAVWRKVYLAYKHAGRLFALEDGIWDESLVRLGITQRARERFALFESIREKGYIPTIGELIVLHRRGDQFILRRGGHHRVASLTVLGAEDLPGVWVDPPAVGSLLRIG
jgi:hypothetical protein